MREARATWRNGIVTLALVLLFGGIFSLQTTAQKVKDGRDNLDALFLSRPELRVTHTPQDSETIRSVLTNGRDIDLFRAENGTEWRVVMDARRGRPTLIDGGAIPFIPGAANNLSWDNLPREWRGNSSVPGFYMEKLARDFMARYQGLLGVNPDELVLNPLGSIPSGNSLYFVRFQWEVKGIPVEGAAVTFIINNGNLIQVSTQNIGDISLDPLPSFSAETAMQILHGYLGYYSSDNDKMLDRGSLSIIPTTPVGHDPDTYQAQKYGRLLDYRLVYRIVFKRPEVTGTWEALIDAHSGEVLRFGDSDRYGRIHGGIRPSDGLPPEEDHPFPGADIDNGARNAFTDSSGNFAGNNATTKLKGQYCIINDTCGAITATTTTGDIDFGMGPAGTDCSVPTGNTYGAGNTKPSRTIFWNVSALNVRAQVWNPTNTWLTNKANAVTVNVNQAAQCNATAGGGVINFFKKAAGCNNLGEVPGVAMHEWGHLYDTSDGSGQQDKPVETYADFIAIMSTHNSCLGAGFLTSGNCGGYGNPCTACTGVRDIDYKKHNPATPWTSTNKGTLWNCSGGSYFGPCGWEDHCESGIAAQALWDLSTLDLLAAPTNMSIDSAWALMDRLWFTGVITMDDFYTCAAAVTSGCTGNTAYNVLRAVDDTGDGTANGTPHAAAIFAAMKRHNIACGAVGDATNQNQTTCPTLTVTTLSGVASNNRVDLSWPAVTNATRYWIFRNEGTCSAGFTRIAVVNSPTLTYADTAVANGTTYNYRMQAATASDACTSDISNCLTATPIPCTAPGVPTIGTVTVPGLNQLRVSWTAGAPAGATYKIYRAIGACPGGAYAQIAAGVAASPYTDNTVSGTVTYSYKVTAVDGTGGCESAQSGCASGTATGTCNAPPTFAGLASVTNPATATCTLNLTWAAGTSNCAGTVTYNIYRSTTAGFTPAAGNRIAAGASGTTYSDFGTLISGTTYYYVVRAVDSANAVEDTNLVQKSGIPTGPVTTGTWTDDAGDTGAAKMLLTAPWSVLATGGKTAPKVYATGTYGASSCQDLKTPVLQLGTGATLSFASKYDIETNWDAGILEVATAPTFTNWTKLAITTYPNTLTNAGNACGIATGGANTAFSSTIAAPSYPASAYTASLTAYNTQQVQIRWNLGSDTTVQGAGWWVDDISITQVQVPGTCVTSGGCTAPGAPTLTSATGTCTGVDLAWTAGTGTTLSYNVYRFTGACGGAYAKIAGPIAGLTYSDTTAVAGTGYAYVIRGACDAGGTTESAISNCLTGTRLAVPAAPTAVTATAGCTGNSVAWTNSAGATSHNVVRGTVCGTAVTTFTNVTSPYNDTTAVAGTAYNYWVVAANTCGNSAISTCAAATRLAIPAVPAAPTFSAVGCADLTVNWTAVSGATSYDVYRKTGANCSGAVKINAAPVAGTSYGDTGLAASTQYGYNIVATNTCGSSTNGTCATVTTTGSPAAPTGLTATGTCTAVDLSWTASVGATSYEVWRTTNSNCTTGAALINSPAGTTYSDTTAVAGTTYYYTVKGVNTCGTSAVSNCANSARLDVPAAPTAVVATGSCADVSVSWTGNAQATSYNVVRGSVCGTALSTFTNVTSPYSDATAVAGTAYQYWVVAVNGCGNSSNSACSTGTRLVIPTPTITGAGANICPAVTVPLSTEASMSGYQWYLGGAPIVGANGSTYAAPASGNYTVSYANAGGCSGTSAIKAVTISACAPNIVYQSSGSFTEITGDGDAFYELGEKWSVQVTLANTGNSIGSAVMADLAGNGITVCSTPASFGNIAAGATAAANYEFVISPTFAPCGGSIGFDVLNKSCTELTPAGTDQLDVFSVTVGQGTLGVPTDLVLQPPTGDTYIREDAAGTNYGTATTMNVRTRNANRNQRSLVAFDVSAIPAGSTVNSATLELDATVSDIELTLDVHHITGAWSEAAVTWTTAPTFSAAADATALTGTVTGWKTWNMTPVVQAWVNGTYANNGLLVKDRTEGSASNDTWTFSTREGAAANAPVLRINYTPPGTLDCSYVGSGTCFICAAPTGLANNGAADVSACAASGVAVTWAADPAGWGDASGTRTYDVLRDGVTLPAGTGIAYPATSFTDTTAVAGTSYTYSVKYNNGCGLNSVTTGTTGTDAVCPPPGEAAPGDGGVGTAQSWTDKTTQTWPSVAGATGYILHRGVLADLTNGNILNGNGDSCTRPYAGFTASSLIEDPGTDPLAAPGKFYWYIVVAINDAGAGPAGNATAGARTVNSTGVCP